MDTILQVKDLSKTYSSGILQKRKVSAVSSVSLSLRKSSILGIVGESGSGKSTLAKTIINLISPSKGKVYFNNDLFYDCEENFYSKDIERVIRRQVQMVFQDPFSSLNPQKDVFSHITGGIKKHKLAAKRDYAHMCIDLMGEYGLEPSLVYRYPKELSGGQCQRVALAKAMAVNPSLLICDEPTASLDTFNQSRILNVLLDMKDTHLLSILFISHNLQVVCHFCDEIMVMLSGMTVEKADAKTLYKSPAHPYTKMLIEASPAIHPSMRKPLEQKLNRFGSSGCYFSSQCPYAMHKCFKDTPALRLVSNNHYCACHLHKTH